MKKFKEFFKHPFIKGSVIYAAASFIVSVLHYVINLLIARFFSLATYGEYMTAISYIAIFAVPFSAINLFLVKNIGRKPVKDRLKFIFLIENLIYTKLFDKWLWLMLAAAVIFWVLRVKSGLEIVSLFAIFVLTGLGFVNQIYQSSFLALKRFSLSGGINIASSILKLFGVLFLIFIIPKIEGIYFLLVVTGIFSILLSKKLIGREVVGNKGNLTGFNNSKSPLDYLSQKSFLLPLISTFGLVGMLSIDLILVKKFFSADNVGLYASLALLGKIILYLAVPLGIVAFTFFTGEESKHERKKVLKITSFLLILTGIISFIFYWLFPDLIVGIIFGGKFTQIVPYVWLAAIFGSLYSLANLFAQYLIAKGNWLSTISLPILFFQTIGIIIYHRSFEQVMFINILAASILLVVYLGIFAKLIRK